MKPIKRTITIGHRRAWNKVLHTVDQKVFSLSWTEISHNGTKVERVVDHTTPPKHRCWALDRLKHLGGTTVTLSHLPYPRHFQI